MANIALFLNDVSGSEILVILLFILIFFGSKSIPGIARTLGKAMYQIKSASAEVQSEIRKSGADIKKDFDLQKMVDDMKGDIAKPFEEHARTLDQSINFEAPKQFAQPTPPKPLDQPADQPTDQPESPVDQH